MASIELNLEQKLKASLRLSPKILYGQNLLFTPLSELTSECERMLGENPFFSFAPPKHFLYDSDIDSPSYENIPALPSIEEVLTPQIVTCPGYSSVRRRADSSFWLSLIGPEGYLNTKEEDAAAICSLPSDLFHSFLNELKYYIEPAGLFACDLTESLLIQLRRSSCGCCDAELLLTEGREYLLAEKLNDFCSEHGWSRERLNGALALLRSLDPSPGRNFSSAEPVFPEIEFITLGDSVTVRLISDNLPRIVSSIGDTPLSPSEILSSDWIAPSWVKTKSVITRLGMRYKTVVRIAMAAALAQSAYIIGKRDTPSPFTYRDAAEAVGLSTSTVFRTVKNTWISADGSVRPFSSLFCRGMAAESSLSIAELKLLISGMYGSGLNDREISERLSVPRRTISYHRKKLNLKKNSAKL